MAARWMTTPDPGDDDHFGVEFEPGPAVGMRLMVGKTRRRDNRGAVEHGH